MPTGHRGRGRVVLCLEQAGYAAAVIAEGLLVNYTAELRDMSDIRVHLNPLEDLRRRWKVARDCSRRGYSTDQVLNGLTGASPTPRRWISG